MARSHVTELPPEDFGHFYTVLCDYLIVDRNGKVSILGVFDRIWIQSFPGGLPNFYVVSSFSARATPDTRVSTVIVNSDGTWSSDVAEGKLIFDPEHPPSGQFRKVQITMEFKGIEFPEPGLYWAEIRRDAELVRRHPLIVTLREGVPDVGD